MRAIGTSNFMPRHLEELLAHAKVLPAVNRVEVRLVYDKYGIVVEAYSPLTKGARLAHPAILRS